MNLRDRIFEYLERHYGDGDETESVEDLLNDYDEDLIGLSSEDAIIMQSIISDDELTQEIEDAIDSGPVDFFGDEDNDLYE